NGAEIINISLASTFEDDLNTIQLAINYVLEKGVIVVAAGGNHALNWLEYPAIFPGVIGVEASNSSSGNAYFANNNEGLDVMAPGVDIISTFWPGATYAWVSGSSASAGYMSGLAALLLSLSTTLTHGELEYIIEETAEPLSGQIDNWDESYGYGQINIKNALWFLDNNLSTYYDENEFDNIPQRATTLTLTGSSTEIGSYISYGSDTDYFCVTAPFSGKINVDLKNIPEGCDYDLFLYEEGTAGYFGEDIDNSRSIGAFNEDIIETVTEGNKYYLEVRCFYGYDHIQPYDLEVSFSRSSGGGGSGSSKVERIFGINRYETAIELSKEGWGYAEEAILTTGENFPDALTASTLSEKGEYPLLISTP
ncbi:MAG: S8 family serine peptidase, partial [Actinomycetia bacterium]|nr:S8 family serine peptidase [Actinomycetes bacterium]